MLQLIATLHTFGLNVADRARTKLTSEPETGSETIEKVLWAVAVIAIVGIVTLAVTNFVRDKAGEIK
ncbi:hypothetical protein AAG589_04985 [Isoptericola sp. F-RaC21]|uniref:hypothetical protein n=1 Tax=Isoptericola sp. F-RaC21 TaxID=3141452 RepID=UPI00315C3A00